MNKRYKKIFSVLFAILIGIGIIFFAWRGNTVTHTEDIEIADDGSWKKGLSVVPQTDLLKTLSSSQWSDVVNNATTTSDIVSRDLLINYVLAQKLNMSTTTISDSDAKAIAQNAASKISLPKARQYTEKDLFISGDNSPTALVEYSKTVDAILQEFAKSQTKNDIEVAFALPNVVGETKRLSDIDQNISHYDKLIKGLLSTKTPSALSVAHLHLIQKYSNIKNMIKPMSEIFSDQLVGLSALSSYRQEIADLSLIIDEFKIALSKIQQ